MPHYKDGSEAQIFDKVKGKPYNTPHEVTGVVVSITPGSESCNLRVAFTDVEKVYNPEGSAVHMVTTRYDYGETKAFEKIGAQ